MPRKKKPFIDKKKAITFTVVHRSQQDPHLSREDAPERVLVPKDRVEEQQKYGIYFDDEYDYLQHLKDTKEVEDNDDIDRFIISAKEGQQQQQKGKLRLPASVFATPVETEVGLLNKAAPRTGPQPDWDPDIVAALDDPDEADPNLEDDFVALANSDAPLPAPRLEDHNLDSRFAGLETIQEMPDLEGEYDSDDDQKWRYYVEGSDDDEQETRSRFTDYSLTSSVMNRNKGLTLLDDQFEKFYEQYDDTEMGSLECDEISGALDPSGDRFQQMIVDADEARKSLTGWENHAKSRLPDVAEEQELCPPLNGDERAAGGDPGSSEEEKDDEEMETILVPASDSSNHSWDGESILSTRSNLYNHPTTISEPSIASQRKVGDTTVKSSTTAETSVFQSDPSLAGLSHRDVQQQCTATGGAAPLPSEALVRPKSETTDQKRLRKGMVKAHRRERRAEKKINKIAFRAEKIKQASNSRVPAAIIS